MLLFCGAALLRFSVWKAHASLYLCSIGTICIMQSPLNGRDPLSSVCRLVAIPAVLTEKVFHEFVQTSNKLEDMERMYDTTHPLAGRPDLAVEPTILLVKDIVASRQICRDPAEEHSAERPSHSEESRLPHNAECPSHSTERLSQSAEPPLHSGERP
eukprot:scpid92412/ scgid4544/ 